MLVFWKQVTVERNFNKQESKCIRFIAQWLKNKWIQTRENHCKHDESLYTATLYVLKIYTGGYYRKV